MAEEERAEPCPEQMWNCYHEPRLRDAFWFTFVLMMKEEWRQNVDFAKRRHIILFPVMLALVSMVVTVGFRFLVGEGVVMGDPALVNQRRSFEWDELKTALHIPIFLFSLGMGSFAFLSRVMVSQRAGQRNFLLAAPAMQPLGQTVNHFAYWAKEVAFYLFFILVPAVLGMTLGIIAQNVGDIETPLRFTSIPLVLLSMTMTLAEGLALSMLASALWTRGKWWSRVVPILVVASALTLLMGWISFEFIIFGLWFQLSHSPLIILPGLLLPPTVALIAASLVAKDFEHQVDERAELFKPLYGKLGFLGGGMMQILVTRELLDLWRSGTVKKMVISYAVPLTVLALLAWLVDWAEFPIPFNLLSYAPFLGFFGFNFYSWLNGIDRPDVFNLLPVTVPQLLRAKVVTYFLTTTWISLVFLLLMAALLDQWSLLPVATVVMITNSIYIVALTSYLMGLRPNKAIFDLSVMFWFYMLTTIPLVILFLLSFSQGDTTLYEHMWSQVQTGGLDAVATEFNEERMRRGALGIYGVSAGLLIAGLGLLALMNRKWGRADFSS